MSLSFSYFEVFIKKLRPGRDTNIENKVKENPPRSNGNSNNKHSITEAFK